MMNDNRISRRAIMGGMASAWAIPSLAMATAAGAARPGAISSKLRTLMMMRGALDDRLVMYWLRGRYYGLVDGEATPLFGVVSACFSRYHAHQDGGFIGARGEISHYTDFETGEVVQSVPNPYTHVAMQPPTRGYPPSPVRIQADATITIAEAPGVQFRNVVHDPEVNGNDVSLSESSMAKTPLPGGKLSLYNEMLTYRAKASDLARADLQRVPCELSFTNTVSWRSWMGMGDRPGLMLSVGAGSYVDAIAELPPAWVKATMQTNPGLLERPLAFLDPVWSTIK
jgi:hypothetical protein